MCHIAVLEQSQLHLKTMLLTQRMRSFQLLKNQLLQMHLAQAALLNQTSSNLFPGLPGLPGLPGVPPGPPNPAAAGGNPLLYYGYYAQMIQGLQSQQQKLLEQLTGKNAAKNILPSSPISTKVCHSLHFRGSSQIP